jgi:hypothetical protein
VIWTQGRQICGPVVTLSQLIMGAVDLQAAQVAVEQGAHGAMCDNGQIAIFMLRRDVEHRPHGNGGAKLGHGSGGIVSLRAE